MAVVMTGVDPHKASHTAVVIVPGATSMNGIALLAHQEPVFGAAPGDTTVRRTLELADPRTLDKIARVRAKVRARLVADRRDSCRVPVAGGGREAAGQLADHRPGRDADHRALGETGCCSHVQEGIRPVN